MPARVANNEEMKRKHEMNSLEAESQVGVEVRKRLHLDLQSVHGLAHIHGRGGAQGPGNEVDGNVLLSHFGVVSHCFGVCQNIARLVDVKLSQH